MKQRYVLYPGPLKCEKDGQSHYVSASTLVRLYGVEMRDCVVFDPDPANRRENYEKCIHLHPRCDDECAQHDAVLLPVSQSLHSKSQAG